MTFSRRGFTRGKPDKVFPLIAALARSGGRVKSAKHRRRRPALDPVSLCATPSGRARLSVPQDAQPAPARSCSRGLGRCPQQAARAVITALGPVCINTGIACLFSLEIKRTSEKIVKFHSLAQFISNSRTTLLALSPFPVCDATGCRAFLADSWNKAFSSD